MKKKFFLLLFFVFCFSLLSSAYARDNAQVQRKGLLWKVRSGSGAVYLLGSIHALKKEHYPLPARIEEAFDESDTLAVEADINDVNVEGLMTALEGAVYPGNETIEDHLSNEAYERAKAKLSESGIPVQLFQRTKPWLLALMLAALEMQKSGLDPEYGIDKHFLGEAKGRKRIVELESIDFQLRLFTTMSDAEQESFLLYTLQDLDASGRETDALIGAWMRGDAKSMESLALEGVRENPQLRPMYKKLFQDRNEAMASKIEGFLREGGTYFVVVGTGHLVGKGGIPGLLKKRGYSVEQW
ncbi:MAG: TraB/GumN family protein [Nitrospirae bacterium]|nr:TraB/GumN family protein [Nitrospirota bacterium]